MQTLLNLLLSKSFLFALPITFLILSCQKDVELEDSNLNPGDELIISGSDEFVFSSSTIREIPLEGIRQNVVPLGKINEQRFGEMKAAFYTNFRLTITGFDPEGPITLDSAFFYFKYNNTYGPFQESLSLEVFELNEAINANDSLTNAEVLNVNSTVIASLNNLNIQSGQEGILKIPVDQSFAQGFVDGFGTSIFANNDGLQDYFKGIYVAVTDNSGEDGLLYLNLTDSDTKFSIFYSGPNSVDSVYDFEITNQAAWLTQYTQDYSSSDVELLLNTPEENHESLYISAYSGTKGEIEIPDLEVLDNAIINKAEISFFQTDFGETIASKFTPPSNLFLFLNNPGGNVSLLPGVSLNDIEDFGGQGKLAEIDGQTTIQYKFNITEYVQEIVNGSNISKELSLSVLNVNSGNRVKIGGGNHPNFPIKLEILYTLAD